MKMLGLLLVGLCLAAGNTFGSQGEYFLFYNIDSGQLNEIGLDRDEVAKVFDDEFGPASEEIPSEVKQRDFYVAKYPNQNYVFILNAPFNCGRLGCNTQVYSLDQDGDLLFIDSSFPIKCQKYEPDKLLCEKGGYQAKKPAAVISKKGPVHYPAPQKAKAL